MAYVTKVIEIPLADLVIGKGQVRLSEVEKDVDELAASIAKVGLLEPIVVCTAKEKGKYEILTGQRRFLAHQRLGRPTILAGVIDEQVDETTARVISVTENLVRRDLNRRDLITACTALFKKYGSIQDVCDETGLPRSKVSEYVKYDRLPSELKALVDSNSVELKAALRALDAASATGTYDSDEAVKLAKEMSGMSGLMQEKLAKAVSSDPSKDVDEAIEHAKAGGKITQMVIEIGPREKAALGKFADDEGTKPGDAAMDLITEGLETKGYLSQSET